MPNQSPEQLARDRIDASLRQSGWTIQDKMKINLSANSELALWEYQTDTGHLLQIHPQSWSGQNEISKRSQHSLKWKEVDFKFRSVLKSAKT